MQATLHRLRIAPRKVNIVVKMVRGQKANTAIGMLRLTPKRAAEPVGKLIASAVANSGKEAESLKIQEIFVTEGITLKRGIPASRGRYSARKKRCSHVTVRLAEAASEKAAPKKAQKAEKKTEAKKESSTEKETKKAPAAAKKQEAPVKPAEKKAAKAPKKKAEEKAESKTEKAVKAEPTSSNPST